MGNKRRICYTRFIAGRPSSEEFEKSSAVRKSKGTPSALSEYRSDNGSNEPRYEGGAIILEGRISSLEAQAAKEKKEKTRRANLQLFFNLMLVVVGAATVAVYIYQATIMRDTLKQTQKAADAAKSAADIASMALARSKIDNAAQEVINKTARKEASDQARAALGASIDTMRRDLRPYLVVGKTEMIGDFLSGNTFYGQVEIVNAGHTPATKIDGCADVVWRPSTLPMTDDYPCPSPNNPPAVNHVQPTGEHSITVIGPNITPYVLRSPGSSLNISNSAGALGVTEKSQLFSSGAFRLYFYGEMSYSDILGTKQTYHTKFCGRYDISARVFDVCEKHNGVD